MGMQDDAAYSLSCKEKSLCMIQAFRCCSWDTEFIAAFIMKFLAKSVGSTSHLMTRQY